MAYHTRSVSRRLDNSLERLGGNIAVNEETDHKQLRKTMRTVKTRDRG